jgi:hypothetical protein
MTTPMRSAVARLLNATFYWSECDRQASLRESWCGYCGQSAEGLFESRVELFVTIVH